MNIKGAFDRLRVELGDCQADRYTDTMMLEWLNDAMAAAYSERPDLFQKTVVVKLQPGNLQAACKCQKVYRIEGLTDACGNLVKDLSKTKPTAGSFFGAYKCGSDTDLPSDYSVDENIGGRFAVAPPVKAGADVYARVVCSYPPEAFTAASINDNVCLDDRWYPAVLDYVKAMMYATETESGTSMGMFNTHMTLFLNRLRDDYKVGRRFSKTSREPDQ